MHITIASSSHAARAQLNGLLEASERESIEWLDPELFISRLEAHTDASAADTQYVWLYAAPWSPSLAVPEELNAWKARQQRVLRLRANLKDRLRFVNLDRAGEGWLDGARRGPALKGSEPSNGDFAVLTMLFDTIAPEYWDIYETLESISWLPTGSPELRHDVKLPQPAALMAFMEQVSQGARWAGLQAESRKQAETIRQLQAEAASQRSELENAERKAAEQASENALLLEQLNAVQEGLEEMRGTSLAAEKRLTADIARLTQDIKTAQSERDGTQKMLHEQAEQARAVLDAQREQTAEATAENAQLLDQLQMVQEELEKTFLAEREVTARVNADVHQAQCARDQAYRDRDQAQRERDVANQQRDEAQRTVAEQRDAMSVLMATKAEQDTALAELRNSLAQETDKVRDAQADNDMLLDQMHQVQEELERYYLANREYQTVIEHSTSIVRRAQLSVIASLKAQQSH